METKMITIRACESEQDLFFRINRVRGLLALTVLFSHIWAYTGYLILVPFNKLVTIAVSLFLFLSGYATERSLTEGRLDTVLKKIYCIKIPHLLWMSVFSYFFGVVIKKVLMVPHSFTERYELCGIRNLFISTNWYIYELLGFFIVFSITCIIKNNRIRIITFIFITIVAFFLLYFSGLVEAYYNSIFAFPLGMVLQHIDILDSVRRIKKGWVIGIVDCGVCFVLMFYMDKTSIAFALVRNVAAAGVIVISYYFFANHDLNCRLNNYLCKISPEIYFFHLPLILLFHFVIHNPFIYATTVTLISVISSVIFNPLNHKMTKIWQDVIYRRLTKRIT